ncbi:hypothetical protein [Larkinella soli]|uniref:hypothetical protein n=1 Tax=Larkinella soli TaxID=1770527 RepID=UPI000FFB3406|nr:hypothetical protein [Larkinella soli]
MVSVDHYPHPVRNTSGRLLQTRIEHPAIKLSFIAFIMVISFPYLDFAHIPTAGLDNSWRMALELIHRKAVVWGQDVIFTYGPLGRWLQRYIITTSPLELLLVDSFFALNLAVLLYSLLPKPLRVWHLPVYFSIWAVVNGMMGEWVHFVWFFYVIYGGIRFFYQPATPAPFLYYLLVLSVVNLFMKVNYGLIGVVFMLSVLTYLRLTRQMSLGRYALNLSVFIALLLTGAYLLRTDLIRYVVSSFYIIDGYNESQAIYPLHKLRLVLLSYGTFLLQILAVIWYVFRVLSSGSRPKRRHLDTLFTVGWVVFISFILLKYAFTRADDGHVTSFVKHSSILFLAVIACVKVAWIRNHYFLLLLFNGWCYISYYAPVYGKIPSNFGSLFVQRLNIMSVYFRRASSEIYPVPQPTLPESIRRKIGRQSADVVPNDISEIYFNGLNYNPRPTLQSYQSYNAYLDRRNQQKYLSASAPDWVIYRYEGIDGKYPLADETQTLLALLQRYEVDDRSPRALFLRKKDRVRPLELVRSRTVPVRLGETLVLPKADSLLHVAYVRSDYSPYGQLLNVLFQPPQLFMTLQAENHTAVRYRAIPSLLAKGMLINARVDDLSDARQLLTTGRVKNKALTGITFEERVRGRTGFRPVLKVTVESYRLK